MLPALVVRRAIRVMPVLPVLRDRSGRPVLPVRKDRKAILETLDRKVPKAPLVLLGLPVLLDLWVLPVRRDQRAILATPALLVHKALLVQTAQCLDPKAPLDPKGLPVLRATLGTPDRKVLRVPPVLLAPLGQMVSQPMRLP